MFFMAAGFDFCLNFGGEGLQRLCKLARLGREARHYLPARTGPIWVQLKKNMFTTALRVMWQKVLSMNFCKRRP